MIVRFCWCFLFVLSVPLLAIGGSDEAYFAVGPLPSGIVLPLKLTTGTHTGLGKCLKEVKTSTLVSKGHNPPPGNGSSPHLSLVERCCEGYKRYKYDREFCIPKCNSKCQNGFCIAPNVCQCFTDHVRNLDDECVTTCPIGCLNGQCMWSGECICKPGYVLEPGQKFCVPMCSRNCGINANCTAPEICSCLKGYHLNATGVCEPICSPPCGNGICTGPSMCSCFPGFSLKDKTCQANCTRGCEKGVCVANDICSCSHGFQLVANGTKCEPICSQDCKFGNCTGPDICTCFAGYKNSHGVCKPACKKGCANGDCVAPEICVCKAGYTLNRNGNECKPVCENGCPHGKCTSPNVCKCDYGYTRFLGVCSKVHFTEATVETPKYHPTIAVQVVKTTYAPKFHPTIFIHDSQSSQGHRNKTTPKPHCTPSCLNGNCTGPNHCKCYVGYAMEVGSSHKCTPYCQGGCPNGHCTAPNTCTCNFGFKRENGICSQPTTPKPHCTPSCLNGHCTGQNLCKCNEGYAMEVGSWHKCTPYCSGGCPNGHCTAPNTCTCNFGFKRVNGTCNVFQFS